MVSALLPKLLPAQPATGTSRTSPSMHTDSTTAPAPDPCQRGHPRPLSRFIWVRCIQRRAQSVEAQYFRAVRGTDPKGAEIREIVGTLPYRRRLSVRV